MINERFYAVKTSNSIKKSIIKRANMKNKVNEAVINEFSGKDFLKVSELACGLGVSESTVRRSLADLEKKGLIKRAHGGAVLAERNNLTTSFTYRTHKNVLEKRKIALKAVRLICDGDVIFIDASTTAYFIVEYLNEFDNLTVVTNGVDTLSLLAKYKIPVISTGGKISGVLNSALTGPFAENLVESVNADVAFFSAQSVNKKGEIFDMDECENNVVRKMIKNAERTVFLCDGGKFGKPAPYKVCDLSTVSDFICDSDISDFFDEKPKCNMIF